MNTPMFNVKKALNLFGNVMSPEDLQIKLGTNLPDFARSSSDGRLLKSWSLNELPMVGERVGFLTKPQKPIAVAVFVTKGGVLKTTLTLNLARMAALHNIRTCVVGLDMQGDISTALGAESETEQADDFSSAVAKMNSIRGLSDVFTGELSIERVLRTTDIPTLQYIPETAELTALDQSLVNRNRREYWLRDKVISPLKERFDLIIMDCSPNWNRLITNALVACDVLLSPLECKINNFRNFNSFRLLIDEFQADLDADFRHLHVPTRLSAARRLSQDIYEWYLANVPGCLKSAIKESGQGEEATATCSSIPEYSPNSAAADEIREMLSEFWAQAELANANATATESNHINKNNLDNQAWGPDVTPLQDPALVREV